VGFLDRFRAAERPPEDFLEREFLIPIPEPPPGLPQGPQILQEDLNIELRLVKDSEGRVVLPAFTSEQRLSNWLREGSPYIAVGGRLLLEVFLSNDWYRIIVDTGDRHVFAIERPQARHMLGLPQFPRGSRVAVGELDVEPEFRHAVRTACEGEPAVVEAYVYGFALVEGDEKPRPNLTVGLLLQPGVPGARARETFTRLGDAVDPQSHGYAFIDFHALDGEVLEIVRATLPPVFQRTT
jgi:hypothetical protein